MAREEVRFESGGESIAAWLFRPERAAAAAAVPCVVMASGFSCVRDQGLDAFGERFAAAGFAALAFDYRHWGDSGGEPRLLVRAGRQRDDWRAAIAYASSLDWVDARRLALWGFSAGGGHVQSLAISERGISAAICVAPLVDGARTLRYIGGLSHVLHLGLAGARDTLRGLRGAEPYRIPAGGPPGFGRGHQLPWGHARLRSDYAAGLVLAQQGLCSNLHRAALSAGAQGTPHLRPHSVLHHRGGRRRSACARQAGSETGAAR